MSHSECVFYRSKLARLAAPFVRAALAQVLIDLVDTHTGDYWRTEDVEELVWFLMPPGDTSEAEPAASTALDPGEALFRKEKEETFALFSTPQAAAIAAWLELAVTWNDLSLRREQVEEAFRFWRERAGRDADPRFVGVT